MPTGWLPLFSRVRSEILVDRTVVEVCSTAKKLSKAGGSTTAAPLEKIVLRRNSPPEYGRWRMDWLSWSSAVCSAKSIYASKTASFWLKS